VAKWRFSVASRGVNQIRAVPVSEEAGLLPLKRPTRKIPVIRSDLELTRCSLRVYWGPGVTEGFYGLILRRLNAGISY
jgi:hypothetical protein